jgi:hypothetical protein
MKKFLLAILMLFSATIAFAQSPAEVVLQTRDLSQNDISLLTGQQILPLSGTNPAVFESAGFKRGLLDALGSYYTASMLDFLSSDQNAGSSNITKKAAIVGMLNRYSTQNMSN